MHITIKQAKAICCKKTGLQVKDVSGFSWFGYNYAIVDRETQARLLYTENVERGDTLKDGTITPMFNEQELRELLPLHQDRISKVLKGERVC